MLLLSGPHFPIECNWLTANFLYTLQMLRIMRCPALWCSCILSQCQCWISIRGRMPEQETTGSPQTPSCWRVIPPQAAHFPGTSQKSQ